ncbi:Serine/threonine-protein kinase PknB [Planctomycetes bacterium Pan216]|uniref:non-specific serine/threonine protein kinase n=1 Tax=Kolteria novifilia TaxID=2527975 RepID=A0A518BBA5_9BACT|nr:Serine/threonine-protein kinase PknB [Planctomycetes bacterium Pan216]
MTESQGVHPTPDELTDFGLGRLDATKNAEIERHIAHCDQCCAFLGSLPNDTLMNRLRRSDTVTEAIGKKGTFRPDWRGLVDAMVVKELSDHPRYRIIRSLGAGGMGTVFQAEHRLMERQVALKIISPQLLEDAKAIERFRLEVKAAARLHHPNIVTAYDAEQVGDLHMLVMEFVDGKSLSEVVKLKGPLPVGHACHYIRQAAIGLSHAAQLGMVHRDIKPHNLMLTRKGQVKILDFGLARFAREATTAEDADSDTVTALTHDGVVLGTPDYMAPEQARDARTADIRADIYSLGCTLYYLLVGRPPFHGRTTVGKLMAHGGEEPDSITELREDIPPEIETILRQMMAKRPDDRFQTPEEIAQSLAPYAKAAKGTNQRRPRETPSSIPQAPVATPDSITDLLDHASGGTPTQAPSTTQLSVPPNPTPPKNRLAVPLILAALAGLLGTGWLLSPLLRSSGTDSGGGGLASAGTTPPPAITTNVPEEAMATMDPSPSPVETAPHSPTGKVLIILPQNGYWPPDYQPVRDALDASGFDCKIATAEGYESSPADSPNGGPPRGPTIEADLAFGDVDAKDFDAVVVFGWNVRDFVNQGAAEPRLRRIVREMFQSGQPVASICAGNAVLADMGLLEGRRVAWGRWPQRALDSYAANLNGAITVEDEPIVLSGQILTGRDDTVAAQFGQRLAQELKSRR